MQRHEQYFLMKEAAKRHEEGGEYEGDLGRHPSSVVGDRRVCVWEVCKQTVHPSVWLETLVPEMSLIPPPQHCIQGRAGSSSGVSSWPKRACALLCLHLSCTVVGGDAGDAALIPGSGR